jgi:hypothetical protein
MKQEIIRNVNVLIIGRDISQYGNINFNSMDDLDKKIDELIKEFGFTCKSVFIEETDEFSEDELAFLDGIGVDY